MATFQAANVAFPIPNIGQMTIPTNPFQTTPYIYIRDGNTGYKFNLLDLIPNAGQIASQSGWGTAIQQAIDAFKQQTGVDYLSLPQQNPADFYSAFGGDTGVKNITDIPSLLKISGNPQPGGNVDISQGQRVNAQGQLVDANGTVISQSVNAGQASGILPPAPTGENASAPVASLQPPTVSLQPGSTDTASVKQLQDYLVSKGYMTQAQVDTGYGTYGPQTTAAVQKLQQDLGVDNSSGVGYYGPLTQKAISTGTQNAGTGTSGGTQEAGSTGSTPANDQAFQEIINNPSLSADQKAAIQAIYDAVSTNDQAKADQIISAMNAASQFSDPYFKAQIQLATDALQRGLQSKEGDLAFQENQLNSALDKLKADTAAAGTNLSLQHAKELKDLQTSYETNLQNTQDALAQSGFTQSTKRARAEQILNENNQGLVESSNQNYSYNTGKLNSDLAYNTQNTADQIANLQRLAQEGKLDLTRQTEANVGSATLSGLGYTDVLGNQPGTINSNAAKDALSFASNFVF